MNTIISILIIFYVFSLACAPSIFSRISFSIARMVRKRGFNLVVYLDDFLIIAPTFKDCKRGQRVSIELLVSLGFDVKWEKILGPSSRIPFLGLVIDSAKEKIELPIDKLEALKSLAFDYAQRNKVTKKDLEIIVGHMCFASRAV